MAGIADADRVNAFAAEAADDIRALWQVVASGGIELSPSDYKSLYEAARDA